MASQLDIAYTTLAAELLDRALDAQFDTDFDEAGAFIKVRAKGRDFWYYKPSLKNGAEDRRTYVGPADDPEISKRVAAFQYLKGDYRARRKLVATLVREARLFAPEQRVGDLIEALWKAGIFRLRACLVGTIAYQTYGSVLGYRMAAAAMQTGDVDVAQFHSISVAVEDSIPPILDILRNVDPTFHAKPSLKDTAGPSKFDAGGGLRLEFLTPNRGSDDYSDKAARMPALGGATAEPLRFLDFLIREPVRAVVLHKGGIAVWVPNPARYTVHKLIVSARRRPGTGKDQKDLLQVQHLTEALVETGRREDLHLALAEAKDRGPAWREAIRRSIMRMRDMKMDHAVAVLDISA